MTTIREALADGVKKLSATSDTPHIDTEILLMLALGKSRVYLFTYPDHVLSEGELQAYLALLEQRAAGWPIAYLTKKRDFWNLRLKVSPATLIPRPETELLVERALTHLLSAPNASILELGTGSGAIALALASERPDLIITAVDISAGALQVANENATVLELTSVNFSLSNWFSNLDSDDHFHLILSNPPYLAPNDPHLLEGDLRFEPQSALVSEADGLADIQHIVETALNYLLPLGWLCVEHGHTQSTLVQEMFKKAGYRCVQTHLDIQGHGRVTEGQAKPDLLA